MVVQVENGGTNNQGPVKDSPLYITLLNVITTVSNLLLGGVSLVAITFANTTLYPVSMKQHIYLCVIGHIILMGTSVHTISVHTSWMRGFRHGDRQIAHLVLQVIGSILAIIGGIIIIVDHGYFNTAHGIFGLIAMILTFISLIGGVVNLKATRLNISPKLIKICHSVFGSLTLCMAFVSLLLGFHEYYRMFSGDFNANMLIVCTVLGLLGTILAPSIGVVRRLGNF